MFNNFFSPEEGAVYDFEKCRGDRGQKITIQYDASRCMLNKLGYTCGRTNAHAQTYR